MKKKAHVLYAVNCDTSRILLILNPETDNETAIKAIYDKIAEIEFCDLEEDDEYFNITAKEEIRRIAERIWLYYDSFYLDTRWEVTYGIATNVEIL